MLTLTMARAFVNNSAYYARGRAYVDEGRVGDVQDRAFPDGSTVLWAQVKGHGAVYDVLAKYRDDQLVSCACGCAAFARTGVMCKHVAALLIAHCETGREEAQRLREREAARLEAERRESEEAQRRRGEIDHLLFMNKLTRRQMMEKRRCEEGAVRLYPTLVCLDERAYLEIRIGSARPYVVRCMADFIAHAAGGGREQLGKEFAFLHTEDELDAQDVALYRQIASLDPMDAKGARVELYGVALDGVMRALLGREVDMRVQDEAPVRAMVTEGAGALCGALYPRGGAHVLQIEGEYAVSGCRGAYFFCPKEREIRCAFGERFDRLTPLFEIMERFPEGMRMEADQLGAVCAQLLAPAGEMLRMEAGRDVLLSHMPAAMRPRFLIDLEGRSCLVCRVEYDYGAVVLTPKADHPHIRRDALAEEEACLCAKRLFPVVRGEGVYAFEGKEEALFELLSERLAELMQDGEVLIDERVKKLHVSARRAITFGMTKNGTQLLVSANLGGLTQPELEAAYAAYRQKKTYIRFEDGTFLSGEALEQAAETAQVMKGMDLTAQELADGANVPMNRAMYLEAALSERENMELSAPQDVEDFLARLRAVRETQAQPPKGLQATLRPYQLTGYAWLCALAQAGFGGILADDMGLGKTLQALAMLLADQEAGKALRALVVCPASLQLNWLAEAQRFTPSLRCEVLSGTAAERRARITAADAPDVLIVSYDQLRRDTQAYHGIRFTHVLLDEAQQIKNAASQGAKAAKALVCDVRFAMTGTPIENRLSELWSIFDFLMPGYLFAYKKFRERYEAPIVQDGDAQAQKDLRLLIAPFILRRMKADVLDDLPEKVETVLRSAMMPEQRKLYLAHAARIAGELEMGETGAQQRMQMLAGLTRLRQICCAPQLCMEGYAGGSGKLEQCCELVREAAASGHRMLLFSQFTSMLDLIRSRLEGEGLGVFVLKGDTPKEERMALVEQFNAGEADVFLISLKAGGTGLNLTGADMVIHYDPWWNTAAQNQATDRAYRIGQTRGVQVFKLIASDSIEERILLLQEEKAKLGEGVIAGDNEALALDEATMRELLKPHR